MVNPVQGWHLNMTEATVWESDGEKNGYSGNSITPMVNIANCEAEFIIGILLPHQLDGLILKEKN
jgi:hypothetical protein